MLGSNDTAKSEPDPAEVSDIPTPEQKVPDSDDKSAVGEEDPGAAIEEMHDPHPYRRADGARLLPRNPGLP